MILAIETSASEGGVALIRVGAPLAGTLLAERRLSLQRKASSQLMPAIDFLVRELGTTGRSPLQSIAVSIGPGSFTGVRIALATAKGIAMAQGLPVYGVSSLLVLAHSVDRGAQQASPLRGAIRHARADEYYFGLWDEQCKAVTDEGRYALGQVMDLLRAQQAAPLLVVENDDILGTIQKGMAAPCPYKITTARPSAAALGRLAAQGFGGAAIPNLYSSVGNS
jgi:tRNA threonylcarbamoyl adenosine modification protein YeaZ